MTNRDIAEKIAYDHDVSDPESLATHIEAALNAKLGADVEALSDFQLVDVFVRTSREMERRMGIALNMVRDGDV